MRWFMQPPTEIAYFCAKRRPGMVFRVSKIRICEFVASCAYCLAVVAVPESVCRKLSAQRSPLNKIRALPETVKMG